MERAGRLLGKMKLPRDCAQPEQLAQAAWPSAVGKKIAAHTGQVKLVRRTLVVEVEDKIWQRQLFTLAGQILRNLRRVIGDDLVEDLEFRIMVPRVGPQRQETLHPTLPLAHADEAEEITDPVLRRLYVTARKKASA